MRWSERNTFNGGPQRINGAKGRKKLGNPRRQKEKSES